MPTKPLAVVALVMTGAGATSLTVIVNGAVPVPLALVALNVALNVPAVRGVPKTTPVFALIASCHGKPVAPQLVGLLVAVVL